MVRVDMLKGLKSFIEFYCPNCKKDMRASYIVDTVYCCQKCNIVWELHWRKSKLSIQQVKEDGWLK